MVPIIFCLSFCFPFFIAETNLQEKQLTGRNGLILAPNGPKVGKTSLWWECSIERLLSSRQPGNNETAEGARDKLYSLKAPPSDLLPQPSPMHLITPSNHESIVEVRGSTI